MRKRALLILSSASGHRMGEKKITEVLRFLAPSFDELDCYRLSDFEEDQKKLASLAENYEAFLISGGDGTFNHILDTICKLDKTPVLGYLNSGTIGDVGRNYGIGKNLLRSLNIIKEGYVTASDVMRLNSSHFAYMAAIGAYADIAYTAPRFMKAIAGRLAYYDLAIKEAFKKHSVHIRLFFEDGTVSEYDTPFLLLLNGRKVGGFTVNRKSHIDDGVFEIYVTKKGMFNGLLHYIPFNRIQPIKARKVRIETDYSGPWCLDGEPGPTGNVEVEVLPQKITIFCSERYGQCHLDELLR